MNQYNSQRNKSYQNTPELKAIPQNIREDIIFHGNGKLINEWGEILGKQYSAISTSRIRKFFGGVERMIEYQANELQLLRPQLAYMVGKEKKDSPAQKVLKHFRDEVDRCIKIVDNSEQFSNFKNFLESIIAYHRFHGGKVI